MIPLRDGQAPARRKILRGKFVAPAFFVTINALGIAADLKIKSSILDPFRHDIQYARMDPVVDWLGDSLPLLALYFGINATWLLMSCKNGLLGKGRLCVWLLVCAVWIAVLASDPLNLRGFREMLNGTAWP